MSEKGGRISLVHSFNWKSGIYGLIYLLHEVVYNLSATTLTVTT